MDRYNHERYPDPTAFEALSAVEREERQKAWKPCVFICSPFAGDVEQNIEYARRYLTFAAQNGAIPFAPHLLYPQALDDSDPEQRKLGLFFGSVFLGKCDELWVFGGRVSEGMTAEINKARRRGMLMRYFNQNCEEVEPYA